MKKTFFFVAFLVLVIAIVISSCIQHNGGVLVSESDGDRGSKIIRDTTSKSDSVVKLDQIYKFKIEGTDYTKEVKTITLQITGSAEKIDMLTEAGNGIYKIRYGFIKASKEERLKAEQK